MHNNKEVAPTELDLHNEYYFYKDAAPMELFTDRQIKNIFKNMTFV